MLLGSKLPGAQTTCKHCTFRGLVCVGNRRLTKTGRICRSISGAFPMYGSEAASPDDPDAFETIPFNTSRGFDLTSPECDKDKYVCRLLLDSGGPETLKKKNRIV